MIEGDGSTTAEPHNTYGQGSQDASYILIEHASGYPQSRWTIRGLRNKFDLHCVSRCSGNDGRVGRERRSRICPQRRPEVQFRTSHATKACDIKRCCSESDSDGYMRLRREFLSQQLHLIADRLGRYITGVTVPLEISKLPNPSS